jgi:sulfatase maturation enzyme AslB (radical SAM superfamily)
MAVKINSFSANEPLFSRYFRRLRLLPAPEIIHRGLNLIIKKAKGGLLPFPQNVHIEVTNKCNLQCPMCPIGDKARPEGFMEFDLFKQIVKQCRRQYSLEKMALMGLGEPFLHPELIEMSRYAKMNKISHVFTSTNVTLLNEEISKNILTRSGFDLLAFSVDGATKGTYDSIRKGADFHKITANIMTFLKMRKSLNKNKPRIVLQFLVMKENHTEKKMFIESWKDKLDSRDLIFLRDVDTFGGQVPDYRLESQKQASQRKPCMQLWRDLTLSWDGDIGVCCKDLKYILKVGNINDLSIKDAWTGARWNELRALHNRSEWGKLIPCSDCNEWNQ